MTHDELRELSGGYALGVLDEPDSTGVRWGTGPTYSWPANVEGREIRRKWPTALAGDVPQVEPPAALRERVLRAATAAASDITGGFSAV